MTNAAIAFDQTFEQRLARVDLSKVMAHMQEETGLGDADIARAEELYRKFLILTHRRPGAQLVPPRIIDEVWHAHITSTRQYMADCDLLFGHYIHHDIVAVDEASWKEQHDRFAETQEIFFEEFNVNLFSMLSAEERQITACVR